MTIVVVGLNHRTAPVELRECFYLSEQARQPALERLSGASGQERLAECVILSTCNRLEMYALADDAPAARERCVRLLEQPHLPADRLAEHLYQLEGEAAVAHLFRVASGLDSLILGEPQILGQVAGALAQAQAAGTSGPVLSHLFAHAIHAGKRARTETDISQHTMSVSHAAALLARQTLVDLGAARGLVVGAGEMGELAARALLLHGARSVCIVSRTGAHAAALARRLGVESAEWPRLVDALAGADVVISATAAPHTVLHTGDVAPAMASRPERPLLLVDVAVPRDVDTDVRALPGVTLFDIDDLREAIQHNRAQREAAAARAGAIAAEECANFLGWLQARAVVPVIVDLRRQADAVVEAELDLALRRLRGLDPREQQIVARMARRIANKLLHKPTAALKTQAETGAGPEFAEVVRELFALDPNAPDEADNERRAS